MASTAEGDFPVACEKCLGDNPYVRMTKETVGRACNLCERPFTVFRWSSSGKERYKTTRICQSCAKVKNLCQSCTLDLEYNLPAQVRDQILAQQQGAAAPEDAGPTSERGKQWLAVLEEGKEGGLTGSGDHEGALGEHLANLAQQQPYYKKSLPNRCSALWRTGRCDRGDQCPFLHSSRSTKDSLKSPSAPPSHAYGGKKRAAPSGSRSSAVGGSSAISVSTPVVTADTDERRVKRKPASSPSRPQAKTQASGMYIVPGMSRPVPCPGPVRRLQPKRKTRIPIPSK